MKKILFSFLCAFSGLVYADDLGHFIQENYQPQYMNLIYQEPASYAVYDFLNGELLEHKNINSVRPIASLTKLMTANVFYEVDRQKNNCYSMITHEDNDYIKRTRTRLPKNEPISCNYLMNAMLISSDNYAASSLARNITNQYNYSFITMMNEKAKLLGMSNTYFQDSSGLSKNNVSTVTDLIILTANSLNNENIRDISSKKNTEIHSYTNPYHKVAFRNSNKLVRNNYYNALLSKTGYIKESGYNLIFVNKTLCNNRLIGVISLNNKSSELRTRFTMNKLIQYGCF